MTEEREHPKVIRVAVITKPEDFDNIPSLQELFPDAVIEEVKHGKPDKKP